MKKLFFRFLLSQILISTFYPVMPCMMAQNALNAVAQKAITLEDIWQKYTFRTKGVPGFNFLKDGKHYATSDGKNIIKNDLTTGQTVGKIYEGTSDFDNYTFSDDESKILLATATESIYRRSSKSFFQVWDGKSLQPLYPSVKQINPSFNNQNTQVAFTS